MTRVVLVVLATLWFLAVAWVFPALAQTPVPARVQTIAELLHAKNPVLAMGGDDQRRELTRMIIEQIVYEFPADGWGWKSADPTRPPSKDALAWKRPELHACDWQDGTTRKPLQPIRCHAVPEQHFIAVAGVNHLGSSPPPDNPQPPSDEPVLAKIRETQALLVQSRADDRQQQIDTAGEIHKKLDLEYQERQAMILSLARIEVKLRDIDERPSWLGHIWEWVKKPETVVAIVASVASVFTTMKVKE